MDEFNIDTKDAVKLIIERLISLESRHRALEEFLVTNYAKETGITFEEVAVSYNHYMKHHSEQIQQEIFTGYSSLQGIIPGDITNNNHK